MSIKRLSVVKTNKLIPKNKRLIESINATGDDIMSLYYVVMLYNLSKALEKKIFKKPTKLLKWCHKEHQTTIKSIKSPHSQYVWSTMNDGIFYTPDGVQVSLRDILYSLESKRPAAAENAIEGTNRFIFDAIERLEEGGTMKDAWETFNQVHNKYSSMKYSERKTKPKRMTKKIKKLIKKLDKF